MKIAIVVQRYGNEVVGGAETHSRKIAERLKEYLNWNVEVITTTALDYRTWNNYFPVGASLVNGIKVHRFPNAFSRWKLFNLIHRLTCRYQPSLERRSWLQWATPLLEKLWYLAQGPYSPTLVKFLTAEESSYDAILFFTYLYHPTVAGIQINPSKSILIPEAHDEPPFYFRATKSTIASARFILTNTDAESRLVTAIEPAASTKIFRAGMGIDLALDLPSKDFIARTEAFGRYVLYMGRVDQSKLVHVLIENFLNYVSSQNDNAITLSLAGGKDPNFQIPDHPQIQYLGFVSESEKVSLIQNSLGMINPSAFESLSIIVAEAMALRTPVLVNGFCEVLRDYRALAKSVFVYNNPEEFNIGLSAMLAFGKSDADNKELDLGRAAIDGLFNWNNIVKTYAERVAIIASRADVHILK